jgi:hypothetical protein
VTSTYLSAKPVAKAFSFCFYFIYSKSQIKRFGGFSKQAQAFK